MWCRIGPEFKLSNLIIWTISKQIQGRYQVIWIFYKGYCWWTKSFTTKDDDYPTIHRVLTIPGGAGFLPSTVWKGIEKTNLPSSAIASVRKIPAFTVCSDLPNKITGVPGFKSFRNNDVMSPETKAPTTKKIPKSLHTHWRFWYLWFFDQLPGWGFSYVLPGCMLRNWPRDPVMLPTT